MEYYVGLPKGSYCEVLGELAKTEVYSYETSSIVLADFWRPDNLMRIQTILSPYLPGINLETAFKFFEFPTEPVLRGFVCSDHPSMTDLMIMSLYDWQIAIEAKYAEYVRTNTTTCEEWLAEKRKNRSTLLPYRHILRAWVEMIKTAKCTTLSMPDFYQTCQRVGYQFLHRTASACFKTNGPEGTTPVLVYQLFYKKDDAEHIAKMESFKDNLRAWAKLLRLQNMKFLIVSVPVTNAKELEKDIGCLKGNHAQVLFMTMQEREIYQFDFDGITVEEVIKGAR